MPTETRYLKNATIDNNGLSCKDLGTSQSASGTYVLKQRYDLYTYYVGIRVWKRSSGGAETEITGGTPVAQVSRSANGEGIQSAPWNCPQTVIFPDDSIVVRVYHRLGSDDPWVQVDTWQTEDIGETQLSAATWTVYYYTYRQFVYAETNYTEGRFYYGDNTYNSRIENFQYTTPPPATYYMPLSSVASGVATLTKAATYFRNLVATAVSAPLIAKATTFFRTLAATASGVPTIWTIKNGTGYATVTFTLKDPSGTPMPGKTLNFTTSHGSVSATSAITGSDGKASTILSAAEAGFAIVCAEWAGDATNPRTFGTVEVNVHHDPDNPDDAKDYDLWVQGKRINDYLTLRASASPSEHIASFEISDIDQWTKEFYDFAIYRLGTKLFFGRVEVLKKTIAPTAITHVEGRSMIQALMRIPISSASYTNQTLKAIIETVHATYVAPGKQVLLGDIPPSFENISVTITMTDTTVYDVLLAAANLGGASLSVDADRKVNIR